MISFPVTRILRYEKYPKVLHGALALRGKDLTVCS